MSINHEINRLLHFAVQRELMKEEDRYYAANRLIDLLKVGEFTPEDDIDEQLPTALPILTEMLDYAVEQGLLEDTTEQRDLFDTRIMDCVMPRPSEVIRRWQGDYARSPKAATDELHPQGPHRQEYHLEDADGVR